MFPVRLSEGYQSFLKGRFTSESARYKALGDTGQDAEIMVIGCCDSRVSPEVIFDAGPGELFVLRNIANLVPPYEPDSESFHGTSASIEFAVNALKLRHIVVLGHAKCGGIRSVYDNAKPLAPGDFIGKWMSQFGPTADAIEASVPASAGRDVVIRKMELAAVEHSLNNLMTFPYVASRVRSGALTLHGAYFGVATGVLFLRDPQTGEFHPCPES